MGLISWLLGGSDEGDYEQYQDDAQKEYWDGINEDDQGRSAPDQDAREGSNWSCNNNPSGRE